MTGILNYLPVNHGIITVDRIKLTNGGQAFVEDQEQITSETAIMVTDEDCAEKCFIETILKTPACLNNVDAAPVVSAIPLYIQQAKRAIALRTHRDEGNTVVYNSQNLEAIRDLLNSTGGITTIQNDLVPVGTFIVYSKMVGSDAPGFYISYEHGDFLYMLRKKTGFLTSWQDYVHVIVFKD